MSNPDHLAEWQAECEYRDKRQADINEAKIAVCDAYRKWLAWPNNQKRQEINAALLKLNEVEQRK